MYSQPKRKKIHMAVKIMAPVNCDFCGDTAKYDARTTMGPWAYQCQSCFDVHGPGQLGTGFGQLLMFDNSL